MIQKLNHILTSKVFFLEFSKKYSILHSLTKNIRKKKENFMQ